MSAASTPVRIAFLLSELQAVLDRNDLARTVDVARMAEDSGIDDVIVGEHLAMGPDAGRDGVPANLREFVSEWRQSPDHPFLEGPTTLAAIAGATSRIRLGAVALLGALRQPVTMAKQLSTLDVLSRGRLLVMPSVSWQPQEYAACDISFSSRGDVLDDAIGAWLALRSDQQPASYSSESVSFDHVWCQPAPIRPGGPPCGLAGAACTAARSSGSCGGGQGFSRCTTSAPRTGPGWTPPWQRPGAAARNWNWSPASSQFSHPMAAQPGSKTLCSSLNINSVKDLRRSW